MNLPKVKFIDIPLSKEVDWIHGFLFQNKWGWSKYIIKKHPEIKRIFSFKREAEQIKFLKKYIIEFRKENKKLIEENKKRYQKEWQKIEKEFFIIYFWIQLFPFFKIQKMATLVHNNLHRM